MNDPGRLLATTASPVLISARHARILMQQSRARSEAAPGIFGRALANLGLKAQQAPKRPKSFAPNVSWAQGPEFLDGYTLVDGVAILDVRGGCLAAFSYYDWMTGTWCVGYSDIAHALAAARVNDRVKAIFARVDCPGGFTDGAFDLYDAMLAARGEADAKPLWAHCTLACSSAYGFAACCDRIWATRHAEVGSIGVYQLQYDESEALAQAGIKVEAIESAPGKTGGHEWKPLSDEARADFQAAVDQVAGELVAVVSAGRGMQAEEITALNARYFLARHGEKERSGVDLGLVDQIGSEEEAFAALLAEISETLPSDSDRSARKAGAQIMRGPKAAKEKAMPKTMAARIKALRLKAEGGDKPASDAVEEIDEILEDAEKTAEEKVEEVEQIVSEATDADGDAESSSDGEAVEDILEIIEDEDLSDEEKVAEIEEILEEGAPVARGRRKPRASAGRGRPRAAGRDGFAVLELPAAKGRERLAARLGRKVAAGKLSLKEAEELLVEAPKTRNLGAAMSGRDRNIGSEREAPKGGRKGSLAKNMKRRVGIS